MEFSKLFEWQLKLKSFWAWLKSVKLLRVILNGLLIYLALVLFWGTLIYFLDGAKFTTGDIKPNWWQCVYFSCISFATIGYGDIVPSNESGQIIILFESMTAIIFIGLFSGYIAFQFLKRPNNLFLTENLHIRNVDRKIFFSPRVGNKGKNLIDCTAYIEIIEIKNDVKRTIIKQELKYTLLEESWFLGINLSSKTNSEFLEAFRGFYNNPDNSLVRILIIGSDIETGEVVSTSKYYKVKDVVFGGRFIDIYHWESLARTKPNWDNLNKTQELTQEQKDKITKYLKCKNPRNNNEFFADCVAG